MTSPSAIPASLGAAMATTTIDDTQIPIAEHTAVAQAVTMPPTMEIEQSSASEPLLDIKHESTAAVNLESPLVQEASREDKPDEVNQPALPQSETELGAPFSMTGSLPLDVLAAFANPMGPINMNLFPDMKPMDYYPQTTVPGMYTLPMATDAPLDNAPYLDPPLYLEEPEETRISAYAKLIFEDGHFYMNTYSVILGRDIAAWRAAMRAEKQRQEEEAGALERKTPTRVKHEESRYSKSIVSESGGILRHGDDSDPEERARRRKLRKAARASKKSKSDGSSSAQYSRRNSVAQASTWKTYQPQQLQRKFDADPVPVNPATFRPSPYDCPLVAIHPPATAPISAYKSISREHVKIAYNSKRSAFEATILGRNGCFIEDQWYHANDIVPLESGHSLQVGGITVKFMLPNQLDPKVAEHPGGLEDEHVVDRYSEGGKEMSLEFTEERREGAIGETSEEESDDEDNENDDDEQNSDEMEEEEPEDDEQELDSDGAEVREDSELVDEEEEEEEPQVPVKPIQHPQITPTVEKKRGPGRPPKNGIMSKREQKQAKKEEQARLEELAKKGKSSYAEPKTPEKVEKPQKADKAEKTVPQPNGAPVKNKVGRPRKHPLPEEPPGPPREKRKYTKRKPKEPKEVKEGETKGSGSGSEGGGKPKKEKVPPRPPRSPSPVMREEDYTPEQLAKPQANYVILIHEALSNAPTQQLGLPDIYRAIYRRYPYFKLKTQTLGWQSSVRHNLSQHPSFRKVEKDGKGWTWGIVDGISIEKEKKKRATPPPPQHHGQMPHQPLYPGHPAHMMGYGPPPPGYMMPPNLPPGQQPHYMMPPHMNGHPPPMMHHMNGAYPPNVYSHMAGPPPSFTAKIPPHLVAPNTPASYSSPYAPKPSDQAPPPLAAVFTEPRPSTDTPMINSAPDNPQPQLSAAPVQVPDSQAQAPTTLPSVPQEPNEHAPVSQPPIQEQPTTTSSNVETVPSPLPVGSPPQPQEQQQAQAPAPPVQPTPPTPNQAQAQPPTPIPSQISPPGPRNPGPASERVMEIAQKFKKNLVEKMKDVPNAEALVASAINRVLGITTQSATPGNSREDAIINALRTVLSHVDGSNIDAPASSSAKPFLTTAEAYQTSATRPISNHTPTHSFPPSKANANHDRSTPTVARPSFSAQGQARQNSTPVPRPSMTGSGGPKRATPEGSVHAPPQSRPSAPSVSPVSTPGTTAVEGATAVKGPVLAAATTMGETTQVAGQKRALEEVDDEADMREFKRLSTSSGAVQVKT